MNAITILAMIAILSGVATLSISGFTVINTVVAQMADNATVGNLPVAMSLEVNDWINIVL